MRKYLFKSICSPCFILLCNWSQLCLPVLPASPTPPLPLLSPTRLDLTCLCLLSCCFLLCCSCPVCGVVNRACLCCPPHPPFSLRPDQTMLFALLLSNLVLSAPVLCVANCLSCYSRHVQNMPILGVYVRKHEFSYPCVSR